MSVQQNPLTYEDMLEMFQETRDGQEKNRDFSNRLRYNQRKIVAVGVVLAAGDFLLARSRQSVPTMRSVATVFQDETEKARI